MSELTLRMSCATPVAECADTNPGLLLHFDPLAGLLQLGALMLIGLLIAFVIRARRNR